MFLLNSRLGLFSAAYSRRHPFSRSYGVILPSSLTRVLPFVLGFSPRPPVSVCGTGTFILDSSFSRQHGFDGFSTNFDPHHSSSLGNGTSLTSRTNCLDRLYQQPAPSILLCHCFSHADVGGIGISTDCPSPTAFALGLGPDLP